MLKFLSQDYYIPFITNKWKQLANKNAFWGGRISNRGPRLKWNIINLIENVNRYKYVNIERQTNLMKNSIISQRQNSISILQIQKVMNTLFFLLGL